MTFEHTLFTQGIEVDWGDLDRTPADDAEAIRRLAAVWFPQLEANISMSGDDWELLSHDVTPTPTGAVLTILARRAAKTEGS